MFIRPESGEEEVASALREPPIPDTLSAWAGAANVVSHLILIAIWIVVATM
jgi:hypothetical protein